MPLTVSYNDQFTQFVNFATAQKGAVSSKAIARSGGKVQGLEAREISPASGDGVGGFSALFRSKSDVKANNSARTLFREAVAGMFGGESRIPSNVRAAMEMKDYGVGKPLTARRIMAVKAAIDAYNAAESVDFFAEPANVTAAERLGYTAAEHAQINRAANLYMAATKGCTPGQALNEVMTPGTKANRLMLYGGRFLDDAKTFGKGMKLMDDFAKWFAGVKAEVTSGRTKSLTAVNTNMTLNPYQTAKTGLGMERFVFEEIACNRSLDLSASRENLFGVKNNLATRFLSMDLAHSQTATILQIPPEKRAVVYESFAAVIPLVKSGTAPDFSYAQILTTRILRNFDAVETLRNEGQLTADALLAMCFPDVQPLPQKLTPATFKAMANGMFDRITRECPEGLGPVWTMLGETGCTVDEAVQAFRSGNGIPQPRYAAAYSTAVEGFDGTTTAGFDSMKIDFFRASNYTRLSDETSAPENAHFSVTFPGTGRIDLVNTGDDSMRERMTRNVHDKVVSLCGPAHSRQALAVMFAMTQGALSRLREGLLGVGVSSNEHSAVDFTISRDATTGAITVNYASPQGCPVTFSWTATIDIYGNTTTTPMQVTVPQD